MPIINKKFSKPCRRCGKLYTPTGKQSKFCPKCRRKGGWPKKI